MALKHLSLLSLCAVLLLLSGCGRNSSPSTAASDGKIKLYGLIPPVVWLASQIGGDKVSCDVLVPPGQSVHSYKPTPRDIARLLAADYYLLIGLPMENSTIRKVLADSKTKIVDITTGIKRRQISAADSCDHDHDHDHGHAHDHDHSHDKHEQFYDTHVWMSPANNLEMAEAICRLLEEIDPAGKDTYRANLNTLIEKIRAVDASLVKQLAPWKGKKFMVYHPAFGYFADHYGMVQEAVETGGKSPTPKQLEKLVKEARAENVKLIFVQPQFPQNSAQAISEALGAEIIMVDPQRSDILAVYQDIADHLTKSK
jgi:zinc transport system substrate-binding protein